MCEDYSYNMEQEQNDILNMGRSVAKKHGMRLSKFKAEISMGLTRDNDEDQWTFDYESYLMSLATGIYETPSEWAVDYYGEHWIEKL